MTEYINPFSKSGVAREIAEVATEALRQAAEMSDQYKKPSYDFTSRVFGKMHPSQAVESYFRAIGYKATQEEILGLADILFAHRQKAVGEFYSKHFKPLLERHIELTEDTYDSLLQSTTKRSSVEK